MLEALQGVTSAVVRVALDGLAQQQRVTADNIANANSAGFQPRRVVFEQALQEAAAIGGGRGDEAVKARLAGLRTAIGHGDYIHAAATPQVELDLEMARLNATVIRYQALIQGLDQSGSFLRMAISGDGSR